MRRCVVLTLASLAASACTPGALKYQQLAPVKGPQTVTLDDLYRAADTSGRTTPPAGARLLAVVNTDSAVGSLAVYEYEELFVLQVYLFNNSARPFGMDPSNLSLMDGNRLAFRQLATR